MAEENADEAFLRSILGHDEGCPLLGEQEPHPTLKCACEPDDETTKLAAALRERERATAEASAAVAEDWLGRGWSGPVETMLKNIAMRIRALPDSPPSDPRPETRVICEAGEECGGQHRGEAHLAKPG